MSLLFSALLFVGGGYLIFRGAQASTKKTTCITGNVTSSTTNSSSYGSGSQTAGSITSISGEQCVYELLVVDVHMMLQPVQGLKTETGNDKEIYRIERRVPFTVGGRTIDPKRAEVRLTPKHEYQGYIRPRGGLADTFGLSIGHATIRENQYIDERLISRILADEAGRKALKPYLSPKHTLHITEYLIQEGDQISAVEAVPLFPQANLATSLASQGNGNTLSATGMLKAAAVSDKGEMEARQIVKEKTRIMMIIGGILMTIALALLLLI